MKENKCQLDAVEEERIEDLPAWRRKCLDSLKRTMRPVVRVVTVTMTMYSSHARQVPFVFRVRGSNGRNEQRWRLPITALKKWLVLLTKRLLRSTTVI